MPPRSQSAELHSEILLIKLSLLNASNERLPVKATAVFLRTADRHSLSLKLEINVIFSLTERRLAQSRIAKFSILESEKHRRSGYMIRDLNKFTELSNLVGNLVGAQHLDSKQARVVYQP